MNQRLARAFFALAILVACGYVIYRKEVNAEYAVPWDSLLLYAVAVGAVVFLVGEGLGKPVAPPKVASEEVFHDVRARLVEWMKVQGVAAIVFFGIAGFYVVQSAVDGAVEAELGKSRQAFEEAEKSVKADAKAAKDELDKTTTLRSDLQAEVDKTTELRTEVEKRVETTLAKVDELEKRITGVIRRVDTTSARSLIATLEDPSATEEDVLSAISSVQARFESFTKADREALKVVLGKKQRESRYESVRFEAEYALSVLGSTAADLIATLGNISAEEDEVLDAVMRAWTGFEQLDEDLEPLVDALATTLSDSPYESVRSEAAFAVGIVGSAVGRGVDALVRALSDKSPTVQSDAAFALSYFGDAAASAVPDLLTVFESAQDPNLKSSIVGTLATIGPAAVTAGQDLVNALLAEPAGDDQDHFYRVILVQALGWIRFEDAAVHLEVIAADPNDPASKWAELSLAILRNGSPAALVVWLAESTDADYEEQRSHLLSRARELGTTWEPVLIQGLKDPNEFLRLQAVYDLSELEPLSDSAIEALRAATQDEDELVSESAKEILAAKGLE